MFYTKTYKDKTVLASECKYCSLSASKKKYSAIRDYKIKLKRKYNLSYEQYLSMYETQDGLCAICGCSVFLTTDIAPKELKAHVDHCHETGSVRGLLCSPCNKGLGFYKDDVNNLQKAIDYLRNAGMR